MSGATETLAAEENGAAALAVAVDTAPRRIAAVPDADASGTEGQLLLESFLQASAGGTDPVLALDGRVIMVNHSAARMLEQIDQAALWKKASEAAQARSESVIEVGLHDGATVTSRCRAVDADGRVLGAIVEFERDTRSRRGIHAAAGLPGVVGVSSAWTKVVDDARTFSRTDLPLLITGETGVGKHAVAAAIAEQRTPNEVTVFDAALESVTGLPTWVKQVQERLQDRRGTVILRHLDALSGLAAQALCPAVDAAVQGGGPRLITTLVSPKRSREDGWQALYDRLAVARLTVPSLRERAEDIPVLVAEFIERHGGSFRCRCAPDALALLERLPWRGNVRELENLIRAVLVSRRTGNLRVEDLPPEVRAGAAGVRFTQLQRIELETIVATMQQVDGNKVEAAQRLGISRSTLYRKLKTYGLVQGDD